MSISPMSRDIVLAARRGLFIIDLESPLSVPRFLPQGGTWDVADVQWNPHVSRAEYIVSTSSEKLLIWNLNLPSSSSSHPGTTSIQHVLRAHYRAITDINWHPAPAERDLVVSTGVDAWVWAWDLRAVRGGRAVFGLSAFNSGGTQVKWNRQDPHVLASSHAGEVLIWDRRKGSLPITRLRAHRSKIYGIDWSPTLRDELVTCSLDRTVKVWDVGTAADSVYNSNTPEAATSRCREHAPEQYTLEHTHVPRRVIRTAYPVWRARYLPFGRGVLSLPQRGATGLGCTRLGRRPLLCCSGVVASYWTD
ncbi:WD40-repeat-containing domain protein [Mycena sp. CBHHK59/15]|nr:WD40-repeat-containing domain protein [Mycena sp. CBHHK59/15]